MGAPAARVSELSHHWAATGHDVTVLTGFPNHPDGKLRPEYRKPFRGLVFREQVGLVNVVRSWLLPFPNRKAYERMFNYGSFCLSAGVTGSFLPRPDLVIATSPQLLVGLSGWWVAKIKRIPFVLEVRDLWPESLAAVGAGNANSFLYRILHKIAGFLYRKARHIVVVTPAFRDHLIRHWRVSPDKISVVHNGVETDLFRPLQSEGIRKRLFLDERFVVSYIGTVGMAHGLETLLEAAQRLQTSAPEVLFLLVGEGAERERIQAITAAKELTNFPDYTGPRNNFHVTANLLFRGGLGSTFAGETVGPYVSQFMLIPTALGTQPISQQWRVFLPGQDFLTTFSEWLNVQNGGSTGLTAAMDPQVRYPRNGRDLTAFAHVDVLSQAYFVALLALTTMNAPLNPGNPYIGSRTQGGFGTFGGGDFASTINEVASRALKAVWFQKWYVHRRLRPEATSGLVHLIKTGQGSNVSCNLNSTFLNSQAVQQSFSKYGTYLLSQAYPEGCPTHPSYPTGHGTVGGACITVLKFFFNGNFVIPNPVMSSDDGLSLQPYTGSQLTVNGELAKLGHNVSFGHGIHAGIHYRSDTDQSLLLGEAVALGVLRDKAACYHEKFSVTLTKFDGTTTTISN